MSERRSVEPREGVAYPVSLGASLSRVGDGDGDDAYVALRYDARVPGIDPTKPGRVRLDENGKRVRVEFQNVVDGERAINYQGVYVENKDDPREAEVECALIFDPDSGSYTIERLGGTVKGLRVTRDAAGDDAGVGMGVNEDTTRAAAAAEARKRPAQDPREAAVMEAAAAAVASHPVVSPKATEAAGSRPRATIHRRVLRPIRLRRRRRRFIFLLGLGRAETHRVAPRRAADETTLRSASSPETG